MRGPRGPLPEKLSSAPRFTSSICTRDFAIRQVYSKSTEIGLWRINFRSWSIENQNLDLGEMFRTTAFENHRQEDISLWSRSTILDRSALEDKVLPWNSQIILDGSEFRGGRCCWSEGCANVDCRMSIDQMQIKIRLLCRGRMRAYSLCAYLCVILIADLWLYVWFCDLWLRVDLVFCLCNETWV